MMTEIDQLEQDGFAVLPGVFGAAQVDAIRHDLGKALQVPSEAAAICSSEGRMFAARNVLTLWPPVAQVWRQPPLPETLAAVLGPGYGLVRVLYFDKPPDQSWGLPWHKDMTVAVRDNRLPSRHFGKPTTKAGVPHVEAPQELLEAMVTVRIHLDDITEENGPLKVLPGSHTSGKAFQVGETIPRTILVNQGDVLLIRPLAAHCSTRSHADTRRHRRLLHLEFAARPDLPDGYSWHTFIAG